MSHTNLDPRQFVKTELGFLGDPAFDWAPVYETRRVPDSDEILSGNVTVVDKIIDQGLRLQYPDISDEDLETLRNEQKILAAHRMEHIRAAMSGILLSALLSKHTTNLIHVTRDSVDELKPGHPNRPIADAAITTESGLGFAIKPADCPVLSIFHAPSSIDRRGIGMVHAGHVGMANGIIPKSFKYIQEQVGFRSPNTYVYVQPHASSSYTLHGPALERVRAGNLSDFLGPENEEGKAIFDMTGVVRAQLEEAGILPYHIVIDDTNSMTDPTLYSHRAAVTGANNYAGRNALAIGFKPTR